MPFKHSVLSSFAACVFLHRHLPNSIQNDKNILLICVFKAISICGVVLPIDCANLSSLGLLAVLFYFFVCLFVSTWRRIVNCSLIGSLIYRIFNLFLDRGNCLRIDGSERWAEFDWRQSSQFAVNIHLFVLRHLCARVVYEWVFMSNPGNLLQLSGDTRLNCAQTTL